MHRLLNEIFGDFFVERHHDKKTQIIKIRPNFLCVIDTQVIASKLFKYHGMKSHSKLLVVTKNLACLEKRVRILPLLFKNSRFLLF